MFSKATFLQSAAEASQFPSLFDQRGKRMVEIAFVGRSNVGKSSLINHLTGNKKLARISSTPGKTQLINFFSIDGAFCLVDLPGYGFAKVAKKQREGWGDLIQEYLEKRDTLRLIVLLCDLRHPPTEDDLALATWAKHYQRPFLIVFTKADKLPRNKIDKYQNENFSLLLEAIGDTPVDHLVYSIKDSKKRQHLIKKIEAHVHGAH